MAFARQVRGNSMTTITRRSLVLGTMAMPIAQSALGQPATSNITRIVVPFPPGGTVDPIVRMVQPGLQQRLSTIIVIENKPGASGSTGFSCSTPTRSIPSCRAFRSIPRKILIRCC